MTDAREERPETKLPGSEGKLFVVWSCMTGTEKVFSHLFPKQGKLSEESGDDAIVFPAEPNADSMHSAWFATKNPYGIFVINGRLSHEFGGKKHGSWSITAVRSSNDVHFYLRDIHGISREIKWAHCHHAIFFMDWDDYDRAVCMFLEILDNYKDNELGSFEEYIKEMKDISGEDKPFLKDARSFACDWYNNMFVWIQNYRIEKDRLFWAVYRLIEAKRELSEYIKKLDWDIEVVPLSAEGFCRVS